MKSEQEITLYIMYHHIPGVFADKHISFMAHVYGFLLYNVRQSSEQIVLLSIGQLGRIALPRQCYHLPHGVNQLHPVVLLPKCRYKDRGRRKYKGRIMIVCV